jgi:hypothetical protein
MGVGGQRHALAALPPGKTRYPLYIDAGWNPGPAWTGAENLAPTGIRSPDRPARSGSLYRLSYRGPRAETRSRMRTVLTFMGTLFVITWINGRVMHGKWIVVGRAGKIGKKRNPLHHVYPSVSSSVRK